MSCLTRTGPDGAGALHAAGQFDDVRRTHEPANSEMLISVVGPSRSGKSTLIAKVRPEFPTFIFLDLDAEEERAVTSISAKGENPGGWVGRWSRNLALLRKVDVGPRHVLVDVGAGSLQTKEGRRFFIDRRSQTIAVVAVVNSPRVT